MPKPCTNSDISATPHLASPLRDITHACDGNTDSFYHSVHKDDSARTYSPFFTIQLEGLSTIKTITVVNVHTGAYCKTHSVPCTSRIDGAKVEVLKGKFVYLVQLKVSKKCSTIDHDQSWNTWPTSDFDNN